MPNEASSAAASFDTAVGNALGEIVANPERFPKCDSRHRYFLMQRFPFRIIFRLAGDEVTIIAFAHHARDPDFWVGR